MQGLRQVIKLLQAIVPVLYCGGLLYYFLRLGGSWKEATEMGLGPTLWGLAIVGGLFCFPLLLKLVWLFAGLRPRGAPVSEDAFDADAVIARHLAQRASEPPPQHPAPRPSFGKRHR
ncbi:hypothetical protein FHS83_001513 [Rhizomicrobium palustre]|uniref:Uncharacterized protein n=1 Tax=Rhizomicrobium palustre TaxID=189966 RepID=A0A846MYB3_9PROT|nr:hypothetical protein [Rhizomicrobium palustre]NIK88195.1 hypothetical protein [Rhizomicrobium palustre]